MDGHGWIDRYVDRYTNRCVSIYVHMYTTCAMCLHVSRMSKYVHIHVDT